MKQFWILSILGLIAYSPASAQRINYSARNVSVETVFNELEKQSGYSFFYKTELVRKLPKINIRLVDLTLTQALDQCLKTLPLTYTIVDKIVAITAKPANKPTLTDQLAMKIRGRVTDEQDNPLAQVSINVTGSDHGTITSSAGEFEITINDVEKKSLQFSSIGFITKEVDFKNSDRDLSVRLSENAGNLYQVQVIGYGNTSKRLNPGNVSTIKSEELSRNPVNNVLSALQGKVPGMTTIQSTGYPGGSYSVLIRGLTSLISNNEPLFIVDGVPYPTKRLPLLNQAQNGGSALNYIDIDDIERVDILKDADATSIYGSRGANGVVLITTKKGKPGKASVDFNVYSGIASIENHANLLNTEDYLAVRKEAKKNDNMPLLPTDYDINGTWDSTRYTDWSKYLQGGNANLTKARASVSGGTSQTRYFISGGLSRQSTVQRSGRSDRSGSLLVSFSTSAFKNRLKFSVSGNYFRDNSTLLPGDFAKDFLYLPPNAPDLYKPDGSLNQSTIPYNPLIYTKLQYTSKTDNFISSATLGYNLSKGFELLTTLGYHQLQGKEFKGSPGIIAGAANDPSKALSEFGRYKRQTWIIEPQLRYKRQIARGDLNIVAGTTIQGEINSNDAQRATGFTDEMMLAHINAARTVITTADNYSQYKYNAAFGRVKYVWDQKYIVSLNGRYDGSSRFGPEKQFHFFGAVAGAWIFSGTEWIKKHLPFLSFGKLRMSYGSAGSDGSENYSFLDTYTAGYQYLGNATINPTRLFNPDLAWELTKKAEGGIELGFIQDRVIVNASYYNNRSTNLLLPGELSAVTGFSSILVNSPVIVENSGLELELHTTNLKRRKLSWTSSFNISFPKNKLIAFPGLESSPVYKNFFSIGQPLNVVKVFRYAGVNQQNGLYQFYDRNGNITQAPDAKTDKTSFVKPGYRYYGGLQNNLTYGRFFLSLYCSFAQQVGTNSLNNEQRFPPGLFPLAIPSEVRTRWQKRGDKSDVQRMISSPFLLSAQDNAVNSTRAFSELGFFRIKNLSIGYNFSNQWLRKLYLRNARLYMQGQNLITFSQQHKGQDPENLNRGSMPSLRVITAGINLTF